MTFVPTSRRARAGRDPEFALVFALLGSQFVLANIRGRGWCIPGGHRGRAESAGQTARREALEEAGAVLRRIHPLGYYVMRPHDGGTAKVAVAFVGPVLRLQNRTDVDQSAGVRLVRLEDVSNVYYVWNDLLAAVFAHAAGVYHSRWPA